jgi:hypothetical protein
MMTVAPSLAKLVAIANSIPAVEPVTKLIYLPVQCSWRGIAIRFKIARAERDKSGRSSVKRRDGSYSGDLRFSPLKPEPSSIAQTMEKPGFISLGFFQYDIDQKASPAQNVKKWLKIKLLPKSQK